MKKRVIFEQEDNNIPSGRHANFADGVEDGIPIAIRMFILCIIVLVTILYLTK